MTATTTTTTSRKRRRPSFRLIVDGCNGPIRFSEHQLKHAADDEKDKWSAAVLMTRDDKIIPRSSSNKKKEGGSKKNTITNTRKEYEQLDIIPLFRHLSNNTDSPFDAFSVMFDGISRNKRPAQVADAESSKEKEWNVDDNILIEITGLYDETDNIIVERVERWRQEYPPQRGQDDDDPVEDVSRMLEKTTLSPFKDNDGEKSDQEEASCTVVVVHRNDLGPGKARSILQPLGLLRPESVSCLFAQGFSSPGLERNANDILHKKLNHPRVGKNLVQIKQQLVLPNCDEQTNPDNKDNGMLSSFHPVVVTDDVYLRQRTVSHGGFVITFHQLWILLVEVQAMNDEERVTTQP